MSIDLLHFIRRYQLLNLLSRYTFRAPTIRINDKNTYVANYKIYSIDDYLEETKYKSLLWRRPKYDKTNRIKLNSRQYRVRPNNSRIIQG